MAAIKKVRIPLTPSIDKLIWVNDPKVLFQQSAYRVSQEHRTSTFIDPFWQTLWKSMLHERSKMLVWRIGTDILPTKSRLASRLGPLETSCPLCQEEDETSLEISSNVQSLKLFGFGCQWGIKVDLIEVHNLADIC